MYLISNINLCSKEKYIKTIVEAAKNNVEYLILREKDLKYSELEKIYNEIVSELKENKKDRKPTVSEKVLNNGKIYLSIRNSGHVKVYYHKTFIQNLGFMIEWISWILVFFIFKQKYSKNKEQFPS